MGVCKRPHSNPLSSMSIRSAFIRTSAVALLALGACNDASMPASAPKSPMPPGAIGTIVGTINGDSMTATFTPVVGGPSRSGDVISPAIYGNQGVTVTVKGTVLSQTFYPPDSVVWQVRINLRNLLTNAIGTNYAGSTPLDSAGVFAFFLSNPTITLPAGCGCTVSIDNPAGVGNFTTPGQHYFWYNSIPTAVQGAPGTDTTANEIWIFKANKSIAHAFIFVLMVDAMWAPPGETSWTVMYNGLTDSLPFTLAEPRWKGAHFQNIVGNPRATVTWSPTGLVIASSNNNRDTAVTRHDSLGTLPAVMDVTLNQTAAGNARVAAVFGFVEPGGAGRRYMVAGLKGKTLGFAVMDSTTGIWTDTLATLPFDNTKPHTIRIRKIVVPSPQAELCLDGNIAVILPYASFPVTPARLNGESAFFGLQGRGGGASVTYTSVTYTIGNDGGGCLP
jgi:hypothetical protein